MTMSDRNCLSYWFPKLLAAGLPVPRTEIVRTDIDLSMLLDGKMPDGYAAFADEVQAAAARINAAGPWFFRTGQGSGKHQWRDTCFVRYHGEFAGHIAQLVEWSHIVDFFGLRHDVWVVREMLPVDPIAVLPSYHDMPLVVEFRTFVGDGQVKCLHPYWPVEPIRDGLRCGHQTNRPAFDRDQSECAECQTVAESLFAQTRNPSDESAALVLAGQAATAFAGDGEWSVDLLKTRRGWFVTDMAEAARSFHYPGCPREPAADRDERLKPPVNAADLLE